MYRKIENLIKPIFFNSTKDLLYLPTNGIIPCEVNMNNEFINDISKIFFKIMEESKIEYFLFAGSAIGLLRDKKNIPWVDDYDIIIFDENIDRFRNEIFPKLLKNGFTIKDESFIQVYSRKFGMNKERSNFFQCDIFITKIENGILRNTNEKGLYHKKNIPISLVRPANYQLFNDMYLPFFKNFKEDIRLEYFDIERGCVIHIGHGLKKIGIPFNWRYVYTCFDRILKRSIENTKKLIENSSIFNLNGIELDTPIDGKQLNKIIFNSNLINFASEYIVNSLKILSYIKQNNLNEIDLSEDLLENSCCIKFYSPNIKIRITIDEISIENIMLLNYVDEININNEKNLLLLNDEEIIWLKKPIINLILK